MSEDKDNPKWAKWVIIILVIAILVVILWILLRPKESYISGGDQNSKIVSLQCKMGESEDAFFVSSMAKSVTHEIRETFKDGEAENISYTFYGVYDSEQTAETINASLHGQYNKYMGKHSISQQSLNPDFATIGNNLKISLYTEKSKLSGLTAVFFFLDNDEFQRFSSRSIDEMKELYENKGFSCEKNE